MLKNVDVEKEAAAVTTSTAAAAAAAVEPESTTEAERATRLPILRRKIARLPKITVTSTTEPESTTTTQVSNIGTSPVPYF